MISNTTVQAVYNANGVTRAWTIPFVYGESENVHLRVSDGTVEIEIAASNFTVDSENQVVIYPKSPATPALAEGYKVAVYRETVITQEADFTNQGGVWPETVEAALDKLTEITQEHGEKLERCAKVTLTDDETPEEYSVRLWAAADAAVEAAASAATNAETATAQASLVAGIYEQVQTTATTALSDIGDAETTALSAIDTSKGSALQSISDASDAEIAAIESAADTAEATAVSNIQSEGESVITTVQGIATTVAQQSAAAASSATDAANSATAAANSATSAAASETAAATSEANAAASETAAGLSETNAATSATAAAASATAASTSQQAAASSAGAAADSKTAAAASETAAATSATAAANAADDVEDAKREIIALAGDSFGFRKASTAYSLEEIAFFTMHMSIWYIECIVPGTTSSGDLVITNPQIDDVVTDGTVTWQVRKQSSTGVGTATAPGLTKLYTDTGNNTDGTITQAKISAMMTAIGTDVSTLRTDMTAAQTDVSTLRTDMTAAQTDVSTLRTDMTTAQTDIDTLEDDLGAAESNISSLQGNMTAAQGNIGTLQNNMATAQTNIANLQNAMSMTYKAKGSVAFANLPAIPDASKLGWVYNIYDDFTTDSRFVEGAGNEYFAGENVVIVEVSPAEYVLTSDTTAQSGKTYYADSTGTALETQPTGGDDISSAGYYEFHAAVYKYDVLTGYIDLSNYPRVYSFDATTGTLVLTTL